MRSPRVLFALWCVLAGCGSASDAMVSLQASGKAEGQSNGSQWSSLLGVPLSPLNNDDLFRQWPEVRDQITREMPCYMGADDSCGASAWEKGALANWRATLEEIALQSSGTERLARVNQWANEWPYVADDASAGSAGDWAKPLELMAGGGDCEDLATMKYVSLLVLGVANDDLLLVGAMDLYRGLKHAFVVVRHEQIVYILDNQIPRLLPEAEHDGRYLPLFAMNQSSLLGNAMSSDQRRAHIDDYHRRIITFRRSVEGP